MDARVFSNTASITAHSASKNAAMRSCSAYSDVYKRQELHPNDILALRREVGLRAGVAVRHEIADDEQSGIAVLVVGKKPVSYTHLDVYKRQSKMSEKRILVLR